MNHEMDKKARGINSTLPPLPDILKSCFPRSSIKLPRYEVELLQLVFGVSTSPECPVSGAAPLSSAPRVRARRVSCAPRSVHHGPGRAAAVAAPGLSLGGRAVNEPLQSSKFHSAYRYRRPLQGPSPC